MSQCALIDIEGSHPQIPTQFDADSGNAIPLANVLTINGLTQPNGTFTQPVWSTGAGNTITVNVQLGVAITGAPANSNDAGLASFDDTAFAVDANGYVTLVGGGGLSVTTQEGDDGISVAPDAGGIFNWNGVTVANATHAKPAYFKDSVAANTIDLDIQVGTERTGAPADKNDAGLVSFDDSNFAVDANGYVTFVGSGSGVVTNTGDDAVAVSPDGGGDFTWIGLTVANATHAKPVFFKDSATANALDLDVQVATEITGAPIDSNDAGLSSYNDTQFTVDANGYVALVGGADLPPVQTVTSDDPTIVGPDASGNLDLTGEAVANATNAKPVFVDAGANALNVEVQVATEITGAPADKFDAGLSSYDDTMFAVDANGYVTLTPSATFTTGSVIFWGASAFEQDNANFFWDDTNNRLGIGTTTPSDDLQVVGSVDVLHTAVESDDHALELIVDAAGFGDVKALDITFTTGAITAVQDEEAILLNIDESASVGGIINGYEVLSTAEGGATVNGYTTGINVNPVIHESGTFGDADNILNKAVDVTAALANGGAGAISIFVADNDTFTIGDAATWDEMEIILATGASGSGVAPTFEYSTGGAAYSAFSPADGTNGFRNTGAILWDSDSLAGWATATSGEFEIRITRTRNTLTTTPIIDELQIASTTEFKWDKDGNVNLNSLVLVVPLAATSGGTGQNLYAVGDILYADSTTTLTKLVAGSNTDVLTLAGGVPTWAAPTVGVVTSITGGPGITITGTAAVPIVNSVIYTDHAISASVISDSGSFATAAITLTLPASPAQGERCEFFATSGVLVVTAAGTQIVHLGSTSTTAGGTLTSSATGDSLSLIYQSATDDWWAISSVGVWTLA